MHLMDKILQTYKYAFYMKKIPIAGNLKEIHNLRISKQGKCMPNTLKPVYNGQIQKD